MCVESECIFKGGVVQYFDITVAVGKVEVGAGPVEDTLVRLDGLAVFGEGLEGGAVDGHNHVVLPPLGFTALVCRAWIPTFLPATTSVPSGFQASVNGRSPTLTSPTLALDRTSQNRTMPSVPQLASSFSLIGWKATRSSDTVAGAPGVLSSVEFLTFVFSGFHMRNVRSAAPVATKVPDAFQEMVRMKWEELPGALGRTVST